MIEPNEYEETDADINIALSYNSFPLGGSVMSNVAEVMRKKVKSVKHTSPISEAARLMKQDRVSALLVKKITITWAF